MTFFLFLPQLKNKPKHHILFMLRFVQSLPIQTSCQMHAYLGVGGEDDLHFLQQVYTRVGKKKNKVPGTQQNSRSQSSQTSKRPTALGQKDLRGQTQAKSLSLHLLPTSSEDSSQDRHPSANIKEPELAPSRPKSKCLTHSLSPQKNTDSIHAPHMVLSCGTGPGTEATVRGSSCCCPEHQHTGKTGHS